MADGRTRKERIKKWIKQRKEFGKKFGIDPRATARGIKMSLAGYENIAGLDKRAIKYMGYVNSDKIKIRKYLPERDNYYVIYRKKKNFKKVEKKLNKMAGF